MRELISVIIPVYNTEKYLRRSIESIIVQSYTDLEIILVDDGSSDSSGIICDEYASRDSRIIVIHKKNEGLVSARKTGLRLATGQYISYIDSDDWIEPNAYEGLADIVSSYSPEIIECNFVKEFKGVSAIRKTAFAEGLYSRDEFIKEISEIMSQDPPFRYALNSTLCSKIIRKSFLEKFQYDVDDSIQLGEDFAVSMQMFAKVENIYFTSKAYYHYCVRERSMAYDDTLAKYDVYKGLATFLLHKVDQSNPIITQYLVYRLFDVLFDYLTSIPETYFYDRLFFPFYNKVPMGSRIIVFGKGLYAKNIIKIATQRRCLEIVDNVDSADFKQKTSVLLGNSYDYILVSIADGVIAEEIRRNLLSVGISRERIKTIDSSYCSLDNFPKDIIQSI